METKNHYKITPRSADLGGGWHRGAKIERRGRGLRLRQSLTTTVYEGDKHGFRHYGDLHQ